MAVDRSSHVAMGDSDRPCHRLNGDDHEDFWTYRDLGRSDRIGLATIAEHRSEFAFSAADQHRRSCSIAVTASALAVSRRAAVPRRARRLTESIPSRISK
jgi:hypothetical protein